MKLSDDVLMAYVRGNLDQAACAEVERALRADPLLAARLARWRAQCVHGGGIVDEPARAAPRAKVVPLHAPRAARAQFQLPPEPRRQWHWQRLAALAASLLVGALAGLFFGYRALHAPTVLSPVGLEQGALVAEGALALALERQAGGVAGPGGVRIGVSFLTREGGYCRSFAVGAGAGLACRSTVGWTVPVLAESAPGEAGSRRQAGSDMPQPVLDAVAQRIDGAALDAAAEVAARQAGWRR